MAPAAEADDARRRTEDGALSRFTAIYRVNCDACSIEARALAIANEQSIEMPLAAVNDDFVRSDIVGRVERIGEKSDRLYEVDISLSTETVGEDAGQLMNMLYGNTSLQDDVVLHDVQLPPSLVAYFGGPRHGLHALRARVDAGRRALTCSALKPQGLAASKLARLAHCLGRGGIDYVKDDHGLADQPYSRFAERLEAVAAAVAALGAERGKKAEYVPSLSGDLDDLRSQIRLAAAKGVRAVMVAPMIIGVSNFLRLVRENPELAFFAHPALAGAARIHPALLFGKLFRLFGADAVIFPNHGGRFGYSTETCRAIAAAALDARDGLKPCAPVPAGGMSLGRVGEMLDFYGANVILLIGGALLGARERLVEVTSAFVAEVHQYPYNR
jgi:ribulose-bisphosphate carboxylase large chain